MFWWIIDTQIRAWDHFWAKFLSPGATVMADNRMWFKVTAWKEKFLTFLCTNEPKYCPAAVRRRRFENHWSGPFNASTAKLGLNINSAVSCFLPKGYVIHSSGPIYFSNILFIWTFLFTWLFLIFFEKLFKSGSNKLFLVMRMILERARVWENCTFFLLSAVLQCEGGMQLCHWLSESKRRERTKVQVQMQHFSFIFYFIHIYFDFFLLFWFF